MLILKFVEPDKRRFGFLRRKKEVYKIDGIICGNTVFNIIELHKKDINRPEIISLLNKYKGSVLDTAETSVNSLILPYMFDYTPYLKRALLSSVCTYLEKEENCSLHITDDDFRFSSEWLDIASRCRKIVLSGIENRDMKIFCNHCFYEFGLNVFVNDSGVLDESFVSINMNIPKNQNFVDLTGLRSKRIYPDKKYFISNESAKKIASFGVSEQMACAAVQVVPFKKIYITAD